jgi:hypothetical protein
MENLKDVGRKVMYPTKGPLEMDSCGLWCNYFNNINGKQFECICYGSMGLISKTTRLLEKQTTHNHYMGLLCTFEFLFNTSKGKFKFKFKLKPIGTIKMCCLLSE